MFVLFMFSSAAVSACFGVSSCAHACSYLDTWCRTYCNAHCLVHYSHRSISRINLHDILYVWFIDVIAFSQFLGGIYVHVQ